MVKFYYNGVIILLFKSMKARIMGAPDNQKDVLKKIHYKNLKLTTMSVTHDFKRKLNLNKLPLQYEPELFPSCVYRAPEYCNIFGSSKIVILGVKSSKRAYEIINYLNLFLREYFI